MLKLDNFFSILDKFAPIELSHKLIEKGDYDNSGIIVKNNTEINRVLFSLDLSEKAVKEAKRLKCDTVVTHHPAIYKPIGNISVDDVKTNALLKAIKLGLNVISMHLNLDISDGGIDASLCKALGGEKFKILDNLDEKNGYGREFEINNLTLETLIKNLKKNLKTTKIVVYGKRKNLLKKGASFCGAGSGYAEKFLLEGKLNADVVITSDMPHHVILELVESGKAVVLITHYSSENYGFFNYYNKVKEATKNKIDTYYFEDKRFL